MTLLRSSQDKEDEEVVDSKHWRMLGKAEREREGENTFPFLEALLGETYVCGNNAH